MKRLTYFLFSVIGLVNAEPLVIIIGAGAAGLAAATRLLEHNFTNLRILEAESRIGGRINSVKISDSFVDLGAEWCDGQDGNLVYSILKNFDLLEPTRLATDIYLSSKTKLEDGFSRELLDIFSSLQAAPQDEQEDTENRTVGNYILEKYPTIIQEKYGNNTGKLKIAENARDLLNFLILLYKGSFSWFEPSLRFDQKPREGDNTLNWKGRGFRIFLDILMRKYPDPKQQLPIDDKILFDKEVTKIRWKTESDGSNIEIICSDNSTYFADHVIFTPSVGVLKEKSTVMFQPELPIEKQISIHDIGFGAVMKVVMYFSEDWWRDSPGFYFVWTEEDKRSVREKFPEGPFKDGQSWITSMHRAYRQDHNPHVLIASFTGELVPEIEVLPEDLLLKGIHFAMNKFLGGDYNVTKPMKIVSSKWYNNPHFRGTYSYQTVYSRRENKSTSAEEDLAIPLMNSKGKPIVQFAGEATHAYLYATVQGAVETGYREANVLLDLFK
ncbi:hypothetical protein JTB14_016448 [Gonioctena quinquepunctata]|nr:hypothetical protein JTB14_016448 [Gonioctena quinquepunctata]